MALVVNGILVIVNIVVTTIGIIFVVVIVIVSDGYGILIIMVIAFLVQCLWSHITQTVAMAAIIVMFFKTGDWKARTMRQGILFLGYVHLNCLLRYRFPCLARSPLPASCHPSF